MIRLLMFVIKKESEFNYPCNGPFECIILNHKIRAGTGIVNLLARDDIIG
jgi:hypothetical protein